MSTNTNAPHQGVTTLESALRQTLGAVFDDELRALVEGKQWYSSSLSSAEVFRFWVRENIETRNDALWVFQALRASERKSLLVNLGIEKSLIAGEPPQEWANRVLDAVGLPRMAVFGLKSVRTAWLDIQQLAISQQDEKAAALSRQRAERLLRTVLLFYLSIGHDKAFAEILADPGTLNIPRRLQKIVSPDLENTRKELASVICEDGWADLGFLNLALRKLSSKLEKIGTTDIRDVPLQIFTPPEQSQFNNLSTALQPYTHDKPSAFKSRRLQLEEAIAGVIAVVDGMISRNVIPDEMLVVESCNGILGPEFRGILDTGQERRLSTNNLPPVGRRILFIARAPCDFAHCVWMPTPWPTH
ncbi:hypothetical protein [Corallococcus sp. AB011P]|uniref:hypothetical protein n=1 Tax=Corallococcus sp. AB011P TaxID=2316735 RepID=UPI0011C45B86|nr:hypothetical protein [Corallococcus sp. AB011P]